MQEHKAIVASAVVVGLALVAGLSTLGWFIASNRATDTITITGSAKIPVTSDLAKWSANFSLRADTSNMKQVLETATGHTEKIRAFIVSKGIEASAITILPIETDPIYDYQKGQDLVGYNVSQQVKVESADIARVEALANSAKDLASQGIVPAYQRTEYYYTKLAELRPQLFAEATKDARTKAEAIARGTDVRVGALRSAKTGVVQVLALNSTDISDYGSYDLSTKEKEVSATVNVSFELLQ